jgi:hypothetical protein
MTIAGILEWLEATAVASFIRESQYGFSIFVAFHILGLMLSVGMLLWVDLRMLGFAMRRSTVSEVYRSLSPWFLVGFAVMFGSGASLFAAYAMSAYGNVYFRIKMVAIALAAVNAVVFHVATERSRADWDAAVRPPAPARLAGFLSILLWMVVILAGRAMSYTIF